MFDELIAVAVFVGIILVIYKLFFEQGRSL